ncbi:hypothetical protein GF323_02220 [Candidatus Woesearchaeota archaeon]|nr:hypothetical protein [Candidatus Woesearchaeota archaeon]
MRKSQYSMEFLIFFAILSIVFFVWLLIYSNLSNQAFLERDRRAINDLGKAIQTHIFAAANAEEGYFSENLDIPYKAGSVDYEIKMQSLEEGSYVFVLVTERNDYVFHIPYTLGRIKKGDNKLYSMCGVVAANSQPLSDGKCSDVWLPNCSNFIDDDGDNLIDIMDGGCWQDYDNPHYDPMKNNETAGTPVDPHVYNYYYLCLTAHNNGFCSNINIINSFIPGTIDCNANTKQGFC